MNYYEDIKAYIDGELTPERAEQVRVAIESDPALRKDYEFMKAVSSQIQQSAKMPEVRGFESAMESVRPLRRFNWRAGIAIGGAAVLLIVFAGPALISKDQSADLAMRTESSASNKSGNDRLDSSGDIPNETEDFAMNVPPRVTNGSALAEEGIESETPDTRSRIDPDHDKFGMSLDDRDAEATRAADGVVDTLNSTSGAGVGGHERAAMRGGVGGGGGNTGDSGTGGNAGGGSVAGAAGAAGGGLAAGGAAATPQSFRSPKLDTGDRQVIKSANFELQVVSLAQAVGTAKKVIKSVNGKFESRAAEEGTMNAVWLTLHVPQDKFDEVVAKLRKLGDVKFEKAGSNDVTESVRRDVKKLSELRNRERKAHFDSTNAKAEADVKESRTELKRIQSEIKTLETRNSVQMNIAATSEINLYLVQKS